MIPFTASSVTTTCIATMSSLPMRFMIVGPEIPGRNARTSSSFAVGTFAMRYRRDSASTTLPIADANSRISWPFEPSASAPAMRTARDSRTTSIARRWFIRRVDPVSTRSAMRSAAPTFGVTSAAPRTSTTRTSFPRRRK